MACRMKKGTLLDAQSVEKVQRKLGFSFVNGKNEW